MAQTKKDDVRTKIVESARNEFQDHGYAASTIRGIAKRAGISTSNVYVYFESKLELLFAIYDPWLRAQILQLEAQAAEIADPKERLRAIIATLWETFPAADGGFGTIFIEGLAVSGREGQYSRDLLHWAEERLSTLVASCVPQERADQFSDTAFAHILFMAFDGFALNYGLIGPSRRLDRCLDLIVDLIVSDFET
ncbi:MAG: TetR/AcrR family transcriptional regulator [Rhodospirillaceae bacterium]|nr:TetR/AcrR family transcriptional regulator [Rhodospirillaceae bacterium]MCY4237684.1 TetR/AcrR family transcriptional regulator [Rhodospirillaceae bacterium]